MNSRTFGRVLLLAFLPVLGHGLYSYYQFTHGLRWIPADLPGTQIHQKNRTTEDDAQLFCLTGALGVVIGCALISAAGKRGENASLQRSLADHYTRLAIRANPASAEQIPFTAPPYQHGEQDAR